MRRADRLFDVIQILRRKGIATAREMALSLEVSERTIYRDIRDLAASGVPIDGEAGVGYMLRPGFDLPPLMFTEAEIEALVLGARIVESWADCELSGAAGNAAAKIAAVIPERLRGYMAGTALHAPQPGFAEPLRIDLAEIRHAVQRCLRARFRYTDAAGTATERMVRPLSLAFFGPVWLLAAWCELRTDFRIFRLDRMEALSVPAAPPFRPEPGKTLADFLRLDTVWSRHAAPPC